MARSPRPARILYLNHVAETSGAEESLLALLSGLDRGAFDPLVVVPRSGSLTDALGELGVQTKCAPLTRPRRARNPLALALAASRIVLARRRIAEIAREWRPDLIHANSTAAALQAPRLPDVPVIWHCRDLVPLGWLARHLNARVGAVIAISRTVRDHLEAEIGDARKIHLIHNGIDTECFRPGPPDLKVRAELGGSPDHFLIGMAGQLIPWKNHRVFLQAAAQVAQRIPNARFAVMGTDVFGDHVSYEGELRALAHELGIEDLLTFAGHRDDMAEAMRALDALVQPSVGEPFGRAVAEAMSTARPVIAVDRAGPAEIIADGVSGILVPPNDPDAIAEALLALASEPERAERLGAAARERICAHFGLEAHADAVQELYREL